MSEPLTQNLTPGDLAELLVVKAHTYSTYADELSTILKTKPSIWLALRKGVQSDTSAERQWSATENGIKETTLKLQLKALEKEMSAIRTNLRVKEMEARNIM